MGIVIASGVLAVLVVTALVRVAARRAGREPLGHCPVCTADAVSVVERATVDETEAELELRCGACGTWRRIVTSKAAAALLEQRIERQRRMIQDAVERLERERVASDA